MHSITYLVYNFVSRFLLKINILQKKLCKLNFTAMKKQTTCIKAIGKMLF